MLFIKDVIIRTKCWLLNQYHPTQSVSIPIDLIIYTYNDKEIKIYHLITILKRILQDKVSVFGGGGYICKQLCLLSTCDFPPCINNCHGAYALYVLVFEWRID